MATLTGYPQVTTGDTAQIDSTQRLALGTRSYDPDGNEYIYLKGLASTVAGDWVAFDEDHITTRLITNCLGRVGVAMAAITGDKYGWYQIYGYCVKALAISGGSCGKDKVIYTTTTAGQVDDVHTGGTTDMVIRAISRVDEDTTADQISVELNYPFVSKEVID